MSAGGAGPLRILVTGAAGSGTSTLAAALARELSGIAIEADDLYWLPTTPPYRERRPAEARRALACDALSAPGPVVVAGSVMGWGSAIEDAFDLVVFLQVPTALRLERLRRRELQRFGRVDEAFLRWAADYDTGTTEGRDLASHLAWLEARAAQRVTVAGRFTVDEAVARVLGASGAG
ncbi:MAG: AAA family ATPase [Burkholderiaceae bacterium]